jgi:serine/threonine protein kinase
VHDERPEFAAGVHAGDVIAGKYRVERILGVGGMGVVVAATHVNLDQRVALKFLLPAAAEHPDVVERFAREARAAAKIQCDHVARVLDVDRLPSGAPYMVMEYMDGEDLKQLLMRAGPMPITLAVGYILQACEALAEAHALGIVHRDLKPANLFLARRPGGEPIVKVLDFGISKSLTSMGDADLTKTSATLGSPRYMSPEQMSSSRLVDVRSDVWAVGVVLYELLGARTPFPADTMTELVAAVLQSAPGPIRVARPDVPDGLARAIDRCLEKAPANRFGNVAELARALAPFGPPEGEASVKRISHVLGGTAGVVAARDASAPRASMSDGSPYEALPQTGETHAPWAHSLYDDAAAVRKRRAAFVIAAVSGLIIAVGLVVGMWYGLGPATDPVRATASNPPVPALPSALPPASSAPTAVSAAAPAPVVAASAAVDQAAVAPPAPALSAPITRPAHHVSGGAASAPPPTTRTQKPNCNPPFIIDSAGHHQYKPECIL